MVVAVADRGLKRICLDCGSRFYDMNQRPIVCPSCGVEFTGAESVKSKRGKVKIEENKTPADVKDEQVEDQKSNLAEDDEDDEDLDDVEDLSLDDVVAMEDEDEDDELKDLGLDDDDVEDIGDLDDLGSLDDLEKDLEVDGAVDEEELEADDDHKS